MVIKVITQQMLSDTYYLEQKIAPRETEGITYAPERTLMEATSLLLHPMACNDG